MSENKFIKHLKGENTAKSVLEIKNQSINTSFANMPQGTSDANRVYTDHSGDAIGVLQGAENWKLNGSTLVYASSINSDGNDYTGETDKTGGSVVLDGNGMAVSGAGLWVNATYTFTGDPTKTVAIFNAGTKWALKLCGHSLFSDNKTIDLTVLIKIGASSVVSKVFTVTTDSFNFCKDLVIDFAESAQTITKVQGNETLKLQVLCSDTSASATIYNGMTVLTSLQRRVDMDTVAGGGYSLGSLETELDNIHSELNGKLNLDGTNTMTGVLKMRASVSFQCALAPYWDGIGFYKLNDNDSVSLMASIESTQGFLPAGTNIYNIGSSAHKWKDLYIARVITGVLNNGGDISIPTKAGTMALESDIGRTNCITQIIQDIKLELASDGTLTLKAGSKVYVPNGSGVFDTVTTTADVSVTRTDSNKCMIWRYPAGNLGIFPISLFFSGPTAPTAYTFMFWYDTTENKCKHTSDGGSTWVSGDSFPLCIVSTDGTKISAIDRIFNGFGYVGRSIFSLPGIRVLRPAGRNDDGTLKNDIGSISTVAVITFDTTDNFDKAIIGWWGGFSRYDYNNWTYNEIENRNYVSGTIWDTAVVGTIKLTNGVISEFNIKTPFHAVDYNDSDYIANCAMPSGKYIDLTLPANGGNVTAPADGYITIAKATGSANEYVSLTTTSNIQQNACCPITGFNIRLAIPVSKGDVVTIGYSASGATQYFRFVYANGAK